MMFRRLQIVVLLCVCLMACQAQPRPVRLWKEVRGMKGKPTRLFVYPAPDSLNVGVAVIVCPGGSYSHTMGIATEGFAVAEWLNSQGISAFVLKYRVGSQGYHYPAMQQDAQMAVQYVRAVADSLHIRRDRVGAMGFSAGGHLVTMMGAFYTDSVLLEVGVDSKYSGKIDFVVPVYPVVSMQEDIAHKRSRRNLIPLRWRCNRVKQVRDSWIDHFSMEKSIPESMPPTLVVTAKDDPVVDYRNSVRLDSALSARLVEHRFLLYETGGHGYGMDEARAPEAAQWKYEFLKFIQSLPFENN